MKFLKYFFIVIASLIALLIIISLFLPSVVRVERSVLINAPVEIVFKNVNDFHKFHIWSPWNKYDPNIKVVYEGPEDGVGAKYIWTSEVEDLGSGSMTILESVQNKFVKHSVVFNQQDSAISEHKLTLEDKKIRTTWAIEFDMGWNLLGRLFGLFMEAAVAGDFDDGLTKLKDLCEKEAKEGPQVEITIENIPDLNLYTIKDSTSNMSEISAKLGQIFKEVMEFVEKNKLICTGAPLSITHSYSETSWVFEAGFPVADNKPKPTGRITQSKIPEGDVVKAVHIGPYTSMEKTYNKITEFIKAKNLKIRGLSWEVYMSDPMNTPPDKLYTFIYFPIDR